jgi:copper resistance protein C
MMTAERQAASISFGHESGAGVKPMRRMTAVVTAFALLFSATSRAAPPQLEKAIPAVGSTVPASPPTPEIRIFFTQPINPAASSIELTTADGKAVAIGSAAGDQKDQAQLFAKLPRLPPGEYRVHWHVTGADTHEVNGHYTFRVGLYMLLN